MQSFCHAGYVPEAGRPRSSVRGRLWATGGVLAVGAVLGSGAPAVAEDAVAAPTVQCSITDPRLAELSGLVAVGDRVLAMNDGGDQLAVYLLDSGCQVIDAHTAAVDPYDPEDMAVAVDGTVWLADTGDNDATRATVALLSLRPDGTTGVYRLTYPDGPHDAEAFLLAPDGTPYVVTKELLGASGVYSPTSALVDGGTVALARVAAVNLTFTGGAIAADGRHLALRTYTDAYVWPLAGSDVIGALGAAPVRIPLPDSPQGEAITFSADSLNLLVASEGLPSDLTRVPLGSELVVATQAPPTGPVPSFTDLTSSGMSPITSALIAAAVATVVVWIGARLRRRA
jgi:hypothetical protein